MNNEAVAVLTGEEADSVFYLSLIHICGMSITVSPFSIPQNSTIMGINSSRVMDLPVMFAVMLLLTVPALLKGRLSRWQGVLLLCIYAAFCAVQFTI